MVISVSDYKADDMLIGRVCIILRDFLFSRFSFSFVIELPFLKFIRYMFTVLSRSEKAVKKL